MLNEYFKLEEHDSSVSREFFSGLTTFLSMSYILFVNPLILSDTGMPIGGLFVATVLASFICTLLMALYANVPFAMAPGMGINTLVTYMFCIGLNFHWQEALAITFLSGLLHIFLMATNMRKVLVKAMPKNFQYATGVGIGMMISYIGIKNAGFLEFMVSPDKYEITKSGMVVADAAGTVPALVTIFTATQITAVIGLVTMLFLLTLEKKTGDSYGALLLGILVATFVGIPLNVTQIGEIDIFDIEAMFGISQIAFSFFGSPGLLSLFESPIKILLTILTISILLLTNIVDSVSTILGIGQLEDAPVIDKEDRDNFENKKGLSAKLDKVLIANSSGGIVSAFLGSSTTTTFCESVTGIAAGGRTGLTSLVVAILFLICLPFANFFGRIPAAAVAPALIIAGFFLVFLVKNISWQNFQDAIPAAFIVLIIPITNSILDGVVAGYLAHIVIQAALGNWKKVHPFIYCTFFAFAAIILVRSFLEI